MVVPEGKSVNIGCRQYPAGSVIPDDIVPAELAAALTDPKPVRTEQKRVIAGEKKE